MTSAKVGTKLRTVDSSALVLEPSLFDDMSMTGPTEGKHYGNLTNQTNELATHAAFFTYLKAAALYDGTAAAANRVGFLAFPGVVPVLTNSNHASGQGLLYQAINEAVSR